MRPILLFLIICLMSACIGTDLVDQPLAPQPGMAVIDDAEITLRTGESRALTFRLLAVDGSELPAFWTWASRNTSVATVDATGVVSGVGSGQTWVVGTAENSYSDSVLVNVAQDGNAIASVTIEGESSSLEIGDTRQLEAILKNVDGEVVNGTVTWTSANPEIASVSQDGFVTAEAAGETNIIATADGIQSVPFEIIVASPGGDTREGEFSGRNGYSAMGIASLSKDELTFSDNFQTQNGPGLYVYLSPLENSVTGGVSLGRIMATSGAQTYVIPPSVDTDIYDHIIIYCKPFGVSFGVATLD